ncbi:hypothetical protein [Halomonas ventosae]|uniref:Phasin protein n=1 Tax=Halomonas ventosae TaxID=229007 RepID=A0A2T0VKM9_9GAMM|nr:hypothetical protein [Halomonas ventosae]PRY70739.1 hypothetical protein BCL64_112110 [Halomonas ventosae]
MSTAKQVSTVQAIPDSVIGFPEGVAEATENVATASQPIFNWWIHHCMDASHPFVRLQQAWMESVFEAIQAETEFLNACATSSGKMSKCLFDVGNFQNPASLHSCYREVAKDMTDAHFSRLGRVAELPEDFQQRLWEEIC